METIYQTIVKDCGCDVGAFDKKNFLITFGHKTLVTLKDFCYFIDVTPLKKKDGNRTHDLRRDRAAL